MKHATKLLVVGLVVMAIGQPIFADNKVQPIFTNETYRLTQSKKWLKRHLAMGASAGFGTGIICTMPYAFVQKEGHHLGAAPGRAIYGYNVTWSPGLRSIMESFEGTRYFRGQPYEGLGLTSLTLISGVASGAVSAAVSFKLREKGYPQKIIVPVASLSAAVTMPLAAAVLDSVTSRIFYGARGISALPILRNPAHLLYFFIGGAAIGAFTSWISSEMPLRDGQNQSQASTNVNSARRLR